MRLLRTRREKTAQEIGAALATAGMGPVVYFSDDASLEPHVVTGYVKALPPGVGAISAGVGFDTVFTRLKKQADEQPIGPASQRRS